MLEMTKLHPEIDGSEDDDMQQGNNMAKRICQLQYV